jgi:Mrp family chromosome partitioning ATPase
MGKILDFLRQAENHRSGQSTNEETVLSRQAEATVIQPEEEDVPFIEVGAPGKKVEGSPAVLAFTQPEPKIHAPHRESRPAATLVPALTTAAPMGVAFQAWPAPTTTTRRVAPELIAYHQPDHPISKQYAALLATMLDGLADGPAPVLLLSGAAEHVGTTTVLLNLAVCACQGQSSVVVVDTNIHQPETTQRLGCPAVPGWREVLEGSVALEQAIHKTPLPFLHLLPVSAENSPSADGLTADAARWMLRWLRGRFDLVLVDAPELGHGQELSALVPHCDGLYLVTPQAQSSPTQVKSLMQAGTRLGGRLRGLIHTHFEN